MSDYDSEKLVVFSVPWCKGWSATVNDVPVEVDKVNAGLCGIRVPSGICEISFTYETPGMKLGIISSIAGVVLLAAYYLVFVVVKRERGNSYVHLYDGDQVDGVKAHGSYIELLTRRIFDSPERGENAEGKGIEFPEIGESGGRRFYFADRISRIARNGEAEKSAEETKDEGDN